MSSGPVLIGDSDTKQIAHRKCVVGGCTYYVCRLPEGDYSVHEKRRSADGYGGYTVEFLMENGTTEYVRGPFDVSGLLFDEQKHRAIAEALGISADEFLAQAVKLTVGRNLWSSTKKLQIVYREDQYTVGPWRQRLRPEFAGQGYEVAVGFRGVVRYSKFDDELAVAVEENAACSAG